jgi:hypothetical protein
VSCKRKASADTGARNVGLRQLPWLHRHDLSGVRAKVQGGGRRNSPVAGSCVLKKWPPQKKVAISIQHCAVAYIFIADP